MIERSGRITGNPEVTARNLRVADDTLRIRKSMLQGPVESPYVPTRELTSKSAYIALFFALPVLLIFVYLGKWEMGIGAWICTGLVLLVMKSHWDLRRSAWFWLSIGIALLLQVPIILLIPWDNRGLTGISLLPIAIVDYGLVYGCVKLAEKISSRNEEHSSPS